MTNTSIAPRVKPLTDKQITAIVSSALSESPTIISETRKIYGTKKLLDDNGLEYIAENQVVGEERVTDITIAIKTDVAKSWLESALRIGPFEAVTTHFSKLIVHKRLGSNEKDRVILITDYLEVLQRFPEFVVAAVCRACIEDNESGFCPPIAVLKHLCEAVQGKITRALFAIAPPEKPKEPPRRREEDSDRGKADRRQLCDFLINRGEADYFDMVRLYSNYQLEGLCASKYHWRLGDPIPPPVAPVIAPDDPYAVDGIF